MSTRSQAQKLWSDELLLLFILGHLYVMHRRGEGPCSVHHISTLPGMPYQRDERVKRLLGVLVSQGLVDRSDEQPHARYAISAAGRLWWEQHRSVLWLFQGMR